MLFLIAGDRNTHAGTSATSRRFVLEAPTWVFPYAIDEIDEMLAHRAFRRRYGRDPRGASATWRQPGTRHPDGTRAHATSATTGSHLRAGSSSKCEWARQPRRGRRSRACVEKLPRLSASEPLRGLRPLLVPPPSQSGARRRAPGRVGRPRRAARSGPARGLDKRPRAVASMAIPTRHRRGWARIVVLDLAHVVRVGATAAARSAKPLVSALSIWAASPVLGA